MKRKALMLFVLIMTLCASPALARRGFGGAFGGAAVQEEMTPEEMLQGLLDEAKKDRLEKIDSERGPKQKDYRDNTVCSFGPQFRDVSRRMTDDWYMFTPIDLSQEGTQTFELIAGNMYVIGEVSVTVRDGRFTVDYAYADTSIAKGREYFTFFSDYESVTKADLERFEKRFSYGKPYSIEEKLGGDTDVLLFVCNTATFKKTTRGIVSYYKSNPERVELREKMLEMIGR